MKRKNKSLLWRIVKSTARGIYSIVLWFAGKIKKTHANRKLKKNPVYSQKPAYCRLELAESYSGSYDDFNKTLDDSLIMLIFGRRGSGKSALGFRLLENYAQRRNCYVLGVNAVLPQWISHVDDAQQVKNGSALLVDESAIAFSSRQSMSTGNKQLSNLMAIARHKDLTLIFVTQNTSMLDRNILKLADVLLVKQGSLLQLEMERNEIKKFYEKARLGLKDKDKSHFYAASSEFEGILSATLPSFWNMEISKNKR